MVDRPLTRTTSRQASRTPTAEPRRTLGILRGRGGPARPSPPSFVRDRSATWRVCSWEHDVNLRMWRYACDGQPTWHRLDEPSGKWKAKTAGSDNPPGTVEAGVTELPRAAHLPPGGAMSVYGYPISLRLPTPTASAKCRYPRASHVHTMSDFTRARPQCAVLPAVSPACRRSWKAWDDAGLGAATPYGRHPTSDRQVTASGRRGVLGSGHAAV